MLVFECPSCKTKMQVVDAHAGKKVACPSCGTHVAAPTSLADAIQAAPAAATTSVPADEPAAITTPDHVPTRPKAAEKDNDERGDDRLPRVDRRGSSQGAAVGMSVGLIVLLVVGISGCAVVTVGGILVALLVPAVTKVREAAARTHTINNMKHLTLAIQNHRDTFKTLPPPRMARQVGQPGQAVDLSWRVSVLPFIDQGPMFQRFDQKNPWDHANNQPFLNQRPQTFENKTRPEPDPTHTTFQYFTGPKTLFPDLDREQFKNGVIPDGPSNTFMFAEAQSGVPWTKPADMVIGDGALPLPGDRFLVAMADGSVRMLDRKKLDDRVLRMLIDPADGQQLPQDWDR